MDSVEKRGKGRPLQYVEPRKEIFFKTSQENYAALEKISESTGKTKSRIINEALKVSILNYSFLL